jgi:hypothetical protein
MKVVYTDEALENLAGILAFSILPTRSERIRNIRPRVLNAKR